MPSCKVGLRGLMFRQQQNDSHFLWFLIGACQFFHLSNKFSSGLSPRQTPQNTIFCVGVKTDL